MKTYFIVMLIISLVAILLLIFFTCYFKLKKYNEKIIKTEEIIDENLTKKLEIIKTLNSDVKKVTGKKDYLKEYIKLDDDSISKIEKDLKLDEAIKLINELKDDYTKLNKDKKVTNSLTELRKIDEVLVSAKKIFNKNATEMNKIIKKFPNNIVAKIVNIKLRNYYNNITDDQETF